jgi:fluoroacetyl-CoA thioesterase
VTDHSLVPGLRGIASTTVTPENVAATVAEGAVPMFSTPSMIGLMERASFDLVAPLIEPTQTTVGTVVDIQHLAASPIGLEARAEVELVEVDGRRLRFRVEAFDSVEKIGEGWHERFIVDLERFTARANEKLSSGEHNHG